MRTWQALVVYRSRALAKELGGKGKELEAAEDYLVRCAGDSATVRCLECSNL